MKYPATTTPPRRVALCVRTASNQYNLARQVEALARYAAAHGWTIVHTYRETASGMDVDRPELEQALRDACERKYDTILVLRLDRISRRPSHIIDFLKTLDEAGVSAVSATEPLETGTPVGRMIMRVLEGLGPLEWESTRRRSLGGRS